MIPLVYLRSSSYNSWDYCQLKYFIVYNLGYYESTGIKANLGSIVHKVCEILANCKKTIQDNPTKKKFTFDDGELQKRFSFTESNLNTDKFVSQLLDKCYEYYTTADKNHNYTLANYTFCEDMINTCLTYNNGQFDPRKQHIFQPEHPFDIPIEEDWAKITYEGEEHQLRIKGTIDLLVKTDDNILELVDYKSGRRLDWATGQEKTYDKLLKDPQLLLYNYAIHRLYPEYKNTIITIFFLRDGGPYSMCYDESHIDLFLKLLKIRFEEIKSCKYPKPINPNRSDFRCTRLCDFYKNNWPGTNKRICNYVEDHIKTYGIEVTSKELLKDGHKLTKYKAPGEIE